MGLSEIAYQIWQDLMKDIDSDRTPAPFSYDRTDPGILTLDTKTFYEPGTSDYINSQNSPSKRGREFVGRRFSPKSKERFCSSFLNSNRFVKEFKKEFQGTKHPLSTNELLDNVAAAILVYSLSDKILGSMEEDKIPEWKNFDSSMVNDLITKNISLRGYVGVSNIIPRLQENDFHNGTLNLQIDLKRRNKRVVIRSPEMDDFPKYIEIDGVTAENQMPKDHKVVHLTPTTMIVLVEEKVANVPLSRHNKRHMFPMGEPNFYTPIDAFDLIFNWISLELERTLQIIKLLQSETAFNFTMKGFSIFLGNRRIYDHSILFEQDRIRRPYKFYDWDLKEQRKLNATRTMLSKLFENYKVNKLNGTEELNNNNYQRLQTAYKSFNEIIESDRDYYYKLRVTLEALEKFYSKTRDSKEDARKALANLARIVFDDNYFLNEVFTMGYCLRSRYTHYEISKGHLQECLKKALRPNENCEENEIECLLLTESLYKTNLELLRQSILLCLLTNVNAEEFATSLRDEEGKIIPKNIKSVIPEIGYIDQFIRYRLKYISRKFKG